MKKIFALIPFFVLFGCNPPKGPTAKEILDNIAKKYTNHNSVTCHVNYSIKIFDKDEPLNYSASCWLIRNDKAPLFNGCLYLKYAKKSGNEEYYDLQKIYSINDSAKSITEYNHPETQSWVINGNTESGVKDIYFLKPSEITDITNDTSNKETLELAKIGYVDYWKVTVKFHNEKEFSDRSKEFWVDRKDTTIKKITAHVRFQGKDECKEWDIDSVKFDKISLESIKTLLGGKFSSYKIVPYGSPSTSDSVSK